MNIREDKLTYLPIKEGKVIWDTDNGHDYDVLMVVDNLGLVWSVPYFSQHPTAPLTDDNDFRLWVEWLTTGCEPVGTNQTIHRHQRVYETTTAFGLANKCVQYPAYGNALLEVIEKRYKQWYKNGEVNREEKELLIQRAREIFKDTLASCEEVDEDTLFDLAILIRQSKPFEFLGVYHWDGDLQFDRKDYIPGKSLSDIPIPKSALDLDDAELAKSDCPGRIDNAKWHEVSIELGEGLDEWDAYYSIGIYATDEDFETMLDNEALEEYFAHKKKK